MAAHAATPGRRFRKSKRPRPPQQADRAQTARRRQGVVPATLGVVYGIYASFIARDGEPVTGWNVLFGVLCAVIVAGLCFLLGRTQRALMPLLRAAAYGTLFGVAMGFLHSLTEASILRSVSIGAVLGAAMTIVTFYIFYTRE